ncbi:MAG TPA: helix-turn-helix domain-containing protein [Bradyrhizobium sp.]|uniref:helix-turn-helix domain-containing protein n=1 Tax=Bradyrhizobium sp. TaxID=376 RepID=UPI002C39FFE0|nr:helix-turn-helix domain-containing protein [Bradyrhizobium sp.]HTA99203.1 helix-turn-helix domain-containing protein [Bradyrhizobium sp.]
MSEKIPDPLDILVGARICVFRSRRGMSQDDLAGELGIAVQQLQKYEKGIDRVGASSLSRIAAVLGVSIGEFFVSVKDGYSSSTLVDRDALQFLTGFLRISDPHVRRAIAQLVEAAADPEPTMKSSMARSADAKRLVGQRADKSGVSLDLHNLWLRGQRLHLKYDAESWQRAVTIFRDAVRENPMFSPCHSGLVQMNNSEHFVHPGLFRDFGKARATLELAKRAIQLDPVDSRAHLCCGWSYAMALREAEAAPHMKLAGELNDNDPWPLLSSAIFYAFCGSIEKARLRAEQSLALSPAPPRLGWAYHGIIRTLCGDFAGAIEAIDRSEGIARILSAWRAAALFYLGQSDMAQQEARRFLNGIRSYWVGSDAPTDEAVVRWVLQAHPISVSGRWETLRDGLRGAGLPVEGIAQPC